MVIFHSYVKLPEGIADGPDPLAFQSISSQAWKHAWKNGKTLCNFCKLTI